MPDMVRVIPDRLRDLPAMVLQGHAPFTKRSRSTPFRGWGTRAGDRKAEARQGRRLAGNHPRREARASPRRLTSSIMSRPIGESSRRQK